MKKNLKLSLAIITGIFCTSCSMFAMIYDLSPEETQQQLKSISLQAQKAQEHGELLKLYYATSPEKKEFAKNPFNYLEHEIFLQEFTKKNPHYNQSISTTVGNPDNQHMLYKAVRNAVDNKDLNIIKNLLKNGAKPNGDDQMFLPLRIAIKSTYNPIYKSLVDMLVDAGANIDTVWTTRDGEQTTALFEVMKRGDEKAARYLLEKGANPRLRFNNNATYFHKIAKTKLVSPKEANLIKALLLKDRMHLCDISPYEKPDYYSLQPIPCSMVTLLLTYNTQDLLNEKDNFNATAFMLAQENKRYDICRILKNPVEALEIYKNSLELEKKQQQEWLMEKELARKKASKIQSQLEELIKEQYSFYKEETPEIWETVPQQISWKDKFWKQTNQRLLELHSVPSEQALSLDDIITPVKSIKTTVSSFEDFIEAIKNKQFETVKSILKEKGCLNFYINRKDEDGRTPLWWATHTEQVELVELLLTYNANPDTADNNYITPLLLATNNKNLKIINHLIFNGINNANINHVSMCNGEQTTALFEAIKNNDTDMMEFLFGYGADAHFLFADKQTYFHKIADLPTTLPEIVIALRNRGLNLNTADDNGATALLIAGNNQKMINLLFYFGGVNINTISICNSKETTALLEAIKNNELETAEQLLGAGANPNLLFKGEQTYLHKTMPYISAVMVKLLLNYHARTNLKNEQGKTAYKIAKEHGRNDIITLIKWHKAHLIEREKAIQENLQKNKTPSQVYVLLKSFITWFNKPYYDYVNK